MKVVLKIPKPTEVKYKVVGKDYTEAANYLLSKPFAACYDAHPTYTSKPDKSKENIAQVTIIAKPTITVPKWDGASKLKGDEKKWWESMMKALHKHEMNHHAIFEKAMKKFKKARESAGDFPTGDLAGIMHDAFADGQEEQKKYDAKTNHGEKEGVTLPV